MENNGVPSGPSREADAPRAWARDALSAVLLVEEQVAERVLLALAAPGAAASRREPSTNVFGEALAVERSEPSRAAEAVKRAEERAKEGERVAVVASPGALAAARAEMRAIAEKRLAVVAHAVGGTVADALALSEIGWGLLFAEGAAESLDLALIARRAAEDSGNPFVVVHQGPRARHTEPLAPASAELCGVFVGRPARG